MPKKYALLFYWILNGKGITKPVFFGKPKQNCWHAGCTMRTAIQQTLGQKSAQKHLKSYALSMEKINREYFVMIELKNVRNSHLNLGQPIIPQWAVQNYCQSPCSLIFLLILMSYISSPCSIPLSSPLHWKPDQEDVQWYKCTPSIYLPPPPLNYTDLQPVSLLSTWTISSRFLPTCWEQSQSGVQPSPIYPNTSEDSCLFFLN